MLVKIRIVRRTAPADFGSVLVHRSGIVQIYCQPRVRYRHDGGSRVTCTYVYTIYIHVYTHRAYTLVLLNRHAHFYAFYAIRTQIIPCILQYVMVSPPRTFTYYYYYYYNYSSPRRSAVPAVIAVINSRFVCTSIPILPSSRGVCRPPGALTVERTARGRVFGAPRPETTNGRVAPVAYREYLHLYREIRVRAPRRGLTFKNLRRPRAFDFRTLHILPGMPPECACVHEQTFGSPAPTTENDAGVVRGRGIRPVAG